VTEPEVSVSGVGVIGAGPLKLKLSVSACAVPKAQAENAVARVNILKSFIFYS
jgi:hypothetical protein